VHKENNTKILNIENIKNPFVAHYAKLSLAKKKLIHDPTCASHNSCPVANINICKYIANYVDL
jgi:hypothetical protein